MALADDFQRITDALPPDWTDLEVDIRIEDESRYIDAAVFVSQVNAQVYNRQAWHWRFLVAASFGHAAAAETVKGVLAKLDAEEIAGELRVAEVREGRSEVVQMWGRPESVREEFRQRRSILVARVLSIAGDLMLSSRVAETLTAAGHEVVTKGVLSEASLDGVDAIVADLDAEKPEALVGLGIPTLGYYSHVDVETKALAEAAGVDKIVPRSRMARELPQLVAALLAG